MTCLQSLNSRFALVFAVLLTMGLLATVQASATETPAGTHVLLKMENSVSSRTAQPNDYVYMRTASPISVNGQIVVPVGSYVQGVVSSVVRSGRGLSKGKAQLGIRLQSLTLPSGTVLKFAPKLESVDAGTTEQRVRGNEDSIKPGGTKGKDAEGVVIWAARGAAVGAMADRSVKGAGIGGGIGSAVGLATVLASRGNEVELRPGSSMDVVFDRPFTLD